MPITSKSRSVWVKSQVTRDPPSTSYREAVYGYTNKSDPVSGGLITFPDGSRFRRSTAYVHASSECVPQAGWHYRGYDTSRRHPISSDCSPGGFRVDEILQSPTWGPLSKDVAPSALAGPSFNQDGIAEARTRALLDLADEKAGIGENLATFKQTIHLMGNPLRGTLDVLKKAAKFRESLIRRGDLTGSWVNELFRLSARSIASRGIDKAIAQRYLEYVYGVKPLLQDIYGCMELAREYGNKPLLLRGRATARRQLSIPEYGRYYASYNTYGRVGPSSVQSKTTCVIWGRVDPDYQGLRTLNQVGLLNPAGLAWDLVPLSFVVDWILPIGPVLHALSAPAGLLFVDGSEAQKTDMISPYSLSWTSPDDNSQWQMSEKARATGSLVYHGYSRTTLRNWPRPDVWSTVDIFKGDRPFKALALLVANIRDTPVIYKPKGRR